MPDIEIKRAHKLSTEEIKKRIEDTVRDLATKFGLTWRWHDDHTVRFEGRGVKGELTHSATEVAIRADLPFLMRPLKGAIVERVEQKMAGLLG